MSVRFDHMLVAAHDKHEPDRFFAEIFGLPEPKGEGFFDAVREADGVDLSFVDVGIEFPGQHYAFLVDDDVFDGVLQRIRSRGIAHWADPQMRHPGEINTNHGGRGVYFDDPDGHSRIRNLVIGSATSALLRSCRIPVLLFR